MVRAHITPFYERRRKIAEDLLTVAMPERVAWRIHAGVGGMFCWVWVDEEWFDDLDLYDRLKVKKVFLAPGRNFFVEPARSAALGRHASRCFRISLTTSAEALESGIDRIAEAIREMRDDPRRP
jgi:valine--pyruvate aminotransferase